MAYYVFETQKRPADAEHPDGVVNVQPIVTRSSLASAMSYYCERKAQAYMSTQFEWVAVEVKDERLKTMDYKLVPTLYSPPEPEENV